MIHWGWWKRSKWNRNKDGEEEKVGAEGTLFSSVQHGLTHAGPSLPGLWLLISKAADGALPEAPKGLPAQGFGVTHFAECSVTNGQEICFSGRD